MKEERMMILSMLQEGKINSEEAVKLLEALEETEPYKDEKDTFIDMDKTKEKNGRNRGGSSEETRKKSRRYWSRFGK